MSGESPGQNRHVVISGGSRGLGRAIVTALLNAGYNVSTFSRNPSEFTQQMSGRQEFIFAPADLSDTKSLHVFIKLAEAKFGTPYCLINCAAIATDGVLATMPEDRIRKMVAINVEGTLLFTRLVVRKMLSRQTGAVILNISSISAIRGFKGLSAYAFTKGGLESFTRALARELGDRGIRVNCVTPGYYDTEMSESLNSGQREQILRRTPLNRIGVPEDVVGAVLFLLSDSASFITGQSIVIDGGSTV